MFIRTITLILGVGLIGNTNSLEVERIDYEGEDALYVEGEYGEHDFDLFKEVLDNNPEVTLVVFGSSDGGLTSESYPISRLIRSNKLNTTVATGAVCISSCTIAWLGGIDRFLEDGSELWIHRPYVPAEAFLEGLIDNGTCEDTLDENGNEVEVCRAWTDVERMEIQDLRTGKIIHNFTKFLFEMGQKPEFILKALDTNPWEYYKIIK